MRLEGKVAMISGGARGMGASEAKLFAKEGARVVIGDVLEEEGHRTEAEINETGGEAIFVRLDVTSEADWERAVSTAVQRFGRLDVLVNNAGILVSSTIEDMPVEMWDQVMYVNAKGVFLGTKAAIGQMKQSGGGSIINISSISGMLGQENVNAGYNASKGAVRIFTKAAAIQYAGDGIRVNSLHPGSVATPMTEESRADPERLRLAMSRIPLGRIADPEEIAYGALFLASDESSYMTGSELVIDGGVTAQ